MEPFETRLNLAQMYNSNECKKSNLYIYETLKITASLFMGEILQVRDNKEYLDQSMSRGIIHIEQRYMIVHCRLPDHRAVLCPVTRSEERSTAAVGQSHSKSGPDCAG